MSNATIDSSGLLAEKLSLAREVASLKPEIDDLRSQVQANQGLLVEKLSLARQVKTLEAELKDERHALESKRIPSQSHTDEDALNEEITKYKAQIEKLKKELGKTRRDLDTSQKELEKVQYDIQKSEKSDRTEDSINAEKLRELKAELAREKQERAKAEKQIAQAASNTDSDKAVLEDKLNQFRAKLRSTKEKLKETESELLEARNTNNGPGVVAEAKNPRKRAFVQIDPDAAIGTPGDVNTKRNKRATSVLGEKSNFSITPFLNKTTSMAGGGRHQDDPVTSIENDNSPSGERQRVKRPIIPEAKKPKVLGPASPSKSNLKIAPVARQRAATKPKLAMVTEDKVMDENDEPPRPLLSKDDPPKPVKPTLKPKLLASFSSFRDGSAPPQQIPQKMHKRKLLGGGPKTIFDDDEEGGALQFGTFNNKNAGQRVLGIGGRSLGGVAVLGIKKKGPIVVADGDFQFSPLKRDRRAASVLASG